MNNILKNGNYSFGFVPFKKGMVVKMKNKILPIITAAVVIIAICIVIFIPKSKEESSKVAKTTTTTTSKNNTTNSNTTNSNTTTVQAKTMEASLNEVGDVEINWEDLDTSNATFINYTSNGTNIELVAIKDSENNIDVAFNTCQVCNGSPYAYFIQKNGKLICQNCGNLFSLSSIGGSSYGCNPMTIDDNNITKTDTGITISKEFLSQNEKLFINVAEH